MKKAQYYRSCKDRKITAKAVKDTATTVAHRGTSGQTDSPLAEPFLNRLYNLTLPTMEEVLSSIPDYQGNALKSVYGDEEELSWVFDKTMLKCPLEEAILSSCGLVRPIEAVQQMAAEGFRLSLVALEVGSHVDPKALLQDYDQPKPSEDFVKEVPDWIKKELSSTKLPSDVKEIAVARILYFCEQQLKKQWTKIKIPLPELAIASSIMLMMKARDLEGWNELFRLGAIGEAGRVYSYFRGGSEKESDEASHPEGGAA